MVFPLTVQHEKVRSIIAACERGIYSERA